MRSRTGTGSWTRRQFVRLSAGVAVSAPMHRLFASSGRNASTGFAYATSAADDGSGSIHAYAIDGDRWTLLETIASGAPSFSCLSSDGKTLYVANAISEVAGLPRGSVSAYRVGTEGRLQLLAHRPLSLAAVRPGHLAISPDGGTLAVAASGGGIYNLIAISEDGSPGSIKAIRKETGSGPHRAQSFAQPHTMIFDEQNGQMLASDFGSDCLSVFALKDERMLRSQSVAVDAGSGPGALVLGASALYVHNTLHGRLDVFRYKREEDRLREKIQSIALDHDGSGGLALHASGRMLYSGGAHLQAWSVRDDGQLVRSKKLVSIAADRLVMAFDGSVLYAVHGESGAIHQVGLSPQTGEPLTVSKLVQADARWTSLSVVSA